MVTVQPDVPPAVALSDNIPTVNDDAGDDHYDNFGNYIGDRDHGKELILELYPANIVYAH